MTEPTGYSIDGVQYGPDDQPVEEAALLGAINEMGTTGLRRWGGYVDEEFLPQLRGRKAIAIYREMSENDAIVSALLWSIDKLIRQVTWRVEAASSDPADQAAASFLETVMDDMSHTWDDMISEILSMLVYGWSWTEVVYKRRLGPTRNPALRSKHRDGLIGWRKIALRAQETLLEWEFDESGGIQAMVQLAPPEYKRTTIPIEKSLLFRTALHKGNPEGRSLLRSAYRSWWFMKRFQEIEGVGVERDLAGMPVMYAPASLFSAAPGSKEHKNLQALKRVVRSVRRDEQEGLVIPMSYDGETKEPEYKFELLTSGGSRALNISAIVERYEQRVLMTVLADFIMVGHESTGSYALHTDKTGIFRTSLNSFATSIANVFNRHEIPRLFALNGWRLARYPEIKPSDVDAPALAELASFVTSLAGAGMQFFPDPDLEEFLRRIAKLPEKSPEVIMMQQQAQAASAAMQATQEAVDTAADTGQAPPAQAPVTDPAPPPAEAPDPGTRWGLGDLEGVEEAK